jgi:hypothetical protein
MNRHFTIFAARLPEGPRLAASPPAASRVAALPLVPLLLAALLIAGVALPARADPTPEHAASCVAALESEADAMAQQYRDGKVEVESELLHRLEQGFAFIGAVYKQGLRSEEATQMLKAAEKAQESLPAAELATRQAACRAEGASLLANANFLERAFVARAAQRRVDKLKTSS